MKMQIAAYISNERMPIGQLYILRQMGGVSVYA